MTDANNEIFSEDRRSNWVRLRTLTALRWVAIAGQLASIAVASYFFDINVNIGAFAVFIGASVILNVTSSALYPQNTRLSERGATLMLLFDVTQLAILLYFSGGLHNPFALLVLAPVSIAASSLRPSSAVLIGSIVIAQVSFVAMFNTPLTTHAGNVVALPDVFLFGSWIAIVIGVVFLGLFSWRVSSEIHSMSDALLATQMALSREQKLTDLGGVVAAAAHELGTPLATIKLVSSELVEELGQFPDLKEDAELIKTQAERCGEIMHSMGSAGKDDLHLKIAPFQSVIEEAAAPHMERGKAVLLELQENALDANQPYIFRRPEIIHGLRNLVQNAVDFSQSCVWVDVWWEGDIVALRIIDDGPGFPASLIGRLGDPFVRRRRLEKDSASRPGYSGMGLGLFIAKTLLERSGAEVSFDNLHDRGEQPPTAGEKSGARVEVRWNRNKLCASDEEVRRALGQNQLFS